VLDGHEAKKEINLTGEIDLTIKHICEELRGDGICSSDAGIISALAELIAARAHYDIGDHRQEFWHPEAGDDVSCDCPGY